MSDAAPGRRPGDECRRAVRLAVEFLRSEEEGFERYQLVRAVHRPDLADRGSTAIWRLTFKARDLLPERPGGIVGKGGEIFLEVDLQGGTTRRLGYGE